MTSHVSEIIFEIVLWAIRNSNARERYEFPLARNLIVTTNISVGVIGLRCEFDFKRLNY